MQKTTLKKKKENRPAGGQSKSRTDESKMKKHYKGEITIYLTLSLPIMLSLFFGALEAVRISAYRVVTDCAFRSAVISVFGEYHRELFREYDLFFIDLSYLTNEASLKKLSDRVSMRMEENLNPQEERILPAGDFFGRAEVDVEILCASRATDLLGSEMKEQVIEYMKDFTGLDFVRDMQALIQIKESENLSEEELGKALEEADRSREEIRNAKVSDSASEEEVISIKETGNLDIQLKFLSPLDLLILKEDVSEVSGQSFNLFEAPSTRKEVLNAGNETFADLLSDPVSNIVFDEYVMQKCGNYIHPKEGSHLKYEAEYLYAGTCLDSVNLSKTIHSVFAIRTAANALSIKRDKEKMAIIKAVSAALSAATRVPDQVYEATIILIWAAAESTYDLEDLLNGKKVAFIKDGKEFHSALSGGVDSLSESACDYSNLSGEEQRSLLPVETSIGSSSGAGSLGGKIKLSYEDYLRILLFGVPSAAKSLRLMDVVELDIRQTEDNETFRIDQCVDAVDFRARVYAEDGTEFELIRSYAY